MNLHFPNLILFCATVFLLSGCFSDFSSGEPDIDPKVLEKGKKEYESSKSLLDWIRNTEFNRGGEKIRILVKDISEATESERQLFNLGSHVYVPTQSRDSSPVSLQSVGSSPVLEASILNSFNVFFKWAASRAADSSESEKFKLKDGSLILKSSEKFSFYGFLVETTFESIEQNKNNNLMVDSLKTELAGYQLLFYTNSQDISLGNAGFSTLTVSILLANENEGFLNLTEEANIGVFQSSKIEHEQGDINYSRIGNLDFKLFLENLLTKSQNPQVSIGLTIFYCEDKNYYHTINSLTTNSQ